VAQSNILLGHFGVSRGNPDRHAIEMMNLILGGKGFSSRLVDRLRTKEGVTYSVASSFPTTTPMRGIFRVSVQTANEKAPQAIAAVQEEMHRMQAELVPNNELEAAKDFLSNNFVFRFSSRFSTLLQLLSLETQGRAPDDLERLLDRYRRVTARDVQLAAQRYLRPDALTILMMGDSGGAENDLRRFGTVRRLSPIQNN
jgi:zinc protease